MAAVADAADFRGDAHAVTSDNSSTIRRAAPTVIGTGDGSANNQMIGPRGNRLARRHDAFLVIRARPFRPHTRDHQCNGRRFHRAATTLPAVSRRYRRYQNLSPVGQAAGPVLLPDLSSDSGKIVIVRAGQYRDGQDLRPLGSRVGGGIGRSFQHSRTTGCMHRQHGAAQPVCGPTAPATVLGMS